MDVRRTPRRIAIPIAILGLALLLVLVLRLGLEGEAPGGEALPSEVRLAEGSQPAQASTGRRSVPAEPEAAPAPRPTDAAAIAGGTSSAAAPPRAGTEPTPPALDAPPASPAGAPGEARSGGAWAAAVPGFSGEHGSRSLLRGVVTSLVLAVDVGTPMPPSAEELPAFELERSVLVRDAVDPERGEIVRRLRECALRVTALPPAREANPWTAVPGQPVDELSSACAVVKRLAEGLIEVVAANPSVSAALAPEVGRMLPDARWELSFPGVPPGDPSYPPQSWEIPREAFLDVLEPGGDLLWVRGDLSQRSDSGEYFLLRHPFGRSVPKGSWRADHRDSKFVDGAWRHRAESHLALEYEADQVDLAPLLSTPQDSRPGTGWTATLHCRYVGTGAISWNPESKRPPNTELHGQGHYRLEWKQEQTDATPAFAISLAFETRLVHSSGEPLSVEAMRQAMGTEGDAFLRAESLSIR